MSVSLFLVFKVVIKYTEIWGGKDIKKTVAFFYPIMRDTDLRFARCDL